MRGDEVARFRRVAALPGHKELTIDLGTNHDGTDLIVVAGEKPSREPILGQRWKRNS
jgi:hypothetical protein